MAEQGYRRSLLSPRLDGVWDSTLMLRSGSGMVILAPPSERRSVIRCLKHLKVGLIPVLPYISIVAAAQFPQPFRSSSTNTQAGTERRSFSWDAYSFFGVDVGAQAAVPRNSMRGGSCSFGPVHGADPPLASEQAPYLVRDPVWTARLPFA